MVVPEKHGDDARLIRHLMPSVGLLVAEGMNSRNWGDETNPVALTVEAEAQPRTPVLEMTLRLLWAEELRAACAALKIGYVPKTTREKCVKKLRELPADEVFAAICDQLRGRDALWRADPPVRQERAA